MSYPDPPDHDDDQSSRGSRRAAGHRPAWDAATYGMPDDGRRAPRRQPVSRGRRDAYRREPPPDRTQPPDRDPHRDETYGRDTYRDAYRGEAPPDWRQSYAEPSPHHGEPAPDWPEPLPYATPGAAHRRAGVEVSDGQETRDRPRRGASRAERHGGRAGRNLPAAIGVGVLLGAAVLVCLFVWRPAFLGLIVVAVGVGSWELVRAIRAGGANPPLIPLIGGGALMTGLAWWGQTDALTFGLVVTVLAAMVWRLADGPPGYGRDVTAATFVAVYLPFLAGFAALLASPADGDLRVLVMLAGVVLSDTGGYVAGVLFGRHPMAPSVSPKKSWEGLAGSLIATAAGGAVLLAVLFSIPVWWGAVFGVAVSGAAVLGDLGESMIKRDLGVKDMSGLLPGHGGLMDRLDSIVFAAPTAYALLVVMAPPL